VATLYNKIGKGSHVAMTYLALSGQLVHLIPV
jgi:hypothetical protein